MMQQFHDLKTWPSPFQSIQAGQKPWEIRKDDRDFKEDDIVILREWKLVEEVYTGQWILARIGHITRGCFGIPDGYCIFTIHVLQKSEEDPF